MVEKEYCEVLRLLNTINHLQDEYDKIATVSKLIKCHIMKGLVDSTNSLVSEATKVLSSVEILEMPETIIESLDREIKTIVDLLKNYGMLNAAVSLNFARKDLAAKSTGTKKLEILGSVAFMMQSIAKHQTEHNILCKFRFRYCYIFDKLLNNIETTRGVSWKDRMRRIAQVKKNYACCCNQMDDFEKSVEIHLEAIQTLKNAFGQYAKQMKLLGYCYSNLGTAYEGLGLIENAKQFYLKGQKIYCSASDWDSVEDKNFSLFLVEKKLERLL